MPRSRSFRVVVADPGVNARLGSSLLRVRSAVVVRAGAPGRPVSPAPVAGRKQRRPLERRGRPRRPIWLRASPAEVTRHLDGATHLRAFPAMGRSITRSSKPLAGRVAGDGTFLVADSARDFWGRTRPVAVGRVAAHPDGAVVEGTVGFPTWLTWYLRAVWIALVLGAVGTTAAVLAGAAPTLAAVAPVLVIGVVIAALSIGLHVGHSDARVDALVERLGGVLQAAEGPVVADPVAAAEGTGERTSARDAAGVPRQDLGAG